MDNIKITNVNINNDISMAKDVIDGKINNKECEFINSSPIYKTTNECISHKPYVESLMNKERVLSIIGSGDQIINSILFKAKDIVGIDISVFPRYFLALKIATIKVLNKDEYLEYFYGTFGNSFLDRFYNLIRQELDENTRNFWDSLYNEYNEKLYNSKLFSDFMVNASRAIINNPFLQDDYYDLLKKNIDKVNIELLKYDIFNVNKLNKGHFDLVLLSNIINNTYLNRESLSSEEFHDRFLNAMKKYKKFLNSIPLNKDGIALTYNFSFNGEIIDFFQERKYQVYKVKENTELFTCENEILIYKKGRR